MRMKLIGICTVWLVVAAASVCAQTFPTRSVRITVQYPSGSGPEVVTRLVADKLSRYWGQPVIVDSRPGANGFIAIDAVKKAAPDGHDLLAADNGPLAINPSLFRKLPYDVERDFAAVALIYRTDFLVVVAANSPYRNVGELIAAARARPGAIAYATPRVGSTPHLGAAMMEALTDTRMLHVPYKEASQMVTSVASGDVAWMLSTLATSGPMLRAGKVKLLAVAARKRLPTHPDIPTVEESGGPGGLEANAWVGLLTTRGAPADVIALINRDVNRALAEPDLRTRLNAFSFLPLPGSAQDMAELIRSETKKYAELVKRTGATED